MKPLNNYINEVLVKNNIKSNNQFIDTTSYDDSEYEYYKHVILAVDEMFDMYETPEEREEWIDDCRNGDDRALFRLLKNTSLSDMDYDMEEEWEDIILDHVLDDVLDAYDKFDKCDDVLNAFGIKK